MAANLYDPNQNDVAGAEVVKSIPIVSTVLGPAIDAQNAAALQNNAMSEEDLYNNTPNPTFLGNYQQGAYMGDYSPEKYADFSPAAYQTISEDPRIRGYQLSALQNMQALANGTADAGYNADKFAALSDANQLARAREGAVMQDAQARGMGGGGLEFALRSQAGQDAANRAQSGGLTAAAQAALMRMQGNTDAMGAASQLRGQDFAANSKNADVVNQFNMYNNANQNRVREMNTHNANTAALYNLQHRQGYEDQRAGYANANIDRNDRNAQTQFSDTMAKNAGIARGIENVGKAMAGGQAAASQNGAATQGQIMGMANAFGGMRGGGGTGGMGGLAGAGDEEMGWAAGLV